MNEIQSQYDVVVMGGGPTGATFATLLAQRTNLRIALFEKERFPREHIGESFSHRVIQVLSESGALAKVLASDCWVQKFGGIYAWDPAAPSVALFDHDKWEADGVLRWAIHANRPDFDVILLDHCRSQGVDVFEGRAVRGTRFDGEGHRVQLEDGREVRARWFIEASGRQTSVVSGRPKAFLSQYRNVAIWNHFLWGRLAQELPIELRLFREKNLSPIACFAFDAPPGARARRAVRRAQGLDGRGSGAPHRPLARRISGGDDMTLFDHAARQLCRVASALVVPPAEQPRLLEIFHHLSSSWGAREIADCPRWSGVTDDCSPYELSVAFSEEGPELRMLVEAQADPACPSGYWEAALGLSRVLEERYGASLARLDAVAPLFAPHGHVWFSALHGAVLWPRSEPLFKIYLNPAARGLHLARRVVEAALGRLGLASSWPAIAGQLGTDDHLQFLALDLAAGAEARVKIYVRHANASPGDLARKVAAVEPEHAAEVLPFLDAVFGRRLARLPRPAITMYTLTGEGGAPSTVTTHVACYPSGGLDRAITKRIAQYLESSGISPRPYRRAVAALNDGRVNDATGIHNYVSLQHQRGRPRITTYLCPRVYLRRLGPIGFDPVVAWPSPVGGVAAGPGELTPGRGL